MPYYSITTTTPCVIYWHGFAADAQTAKNLANEYLDANSLPPLPEIVLVKTISRAKETRLRAWSTAAMPWESPAK